MLIFLYILDRTHRSGLLCYVCVWALWCRSKSESRSSEFHVETLGGFHSLSCHVMSLPSNKNKFPRNESRLLGEKPFCLGNYWHSKILLMGVGTCISSTGPETGIKLMETFSFPDSGGKTGTELGLCSFCGVCVGIWVHWKHSGYSLAAQCRKNWEVVLSALSSQCNTAMSPQDGRKHTEVRRPARVLFHLLHAEV